MIYFDVETKKTILKRIRGCLLPHGYLFLGGAETTMNLDSAYRVVNFGRTVVYAPGSGATAPASGAS
jgi:chemotaxis protein methyltransferase CheR